MLTSLEKEADYQRMMDAREGVRIVRAQNEVRSAFIARIDQLYTALLPFAIAHETDTVETLDIVTLCALAHEALEG